MYLILPLDRGPAQRPSKLLARENIFQEYVRVIKFYIFIYIKGRRGYTGDFGVII